MAKKRPTRGFALGRGFVSARAFGPALVAVAALIATTPLSAAEPAPVARQFLEQHCADCHDPDTAKGDFSLNQLSLEPSGPDQVDLLVRLLDRVQSGEMPPKKSDQPLPAAREAFLADLGRRAVAAESKLGNPSRRTSIRRMNRVEYEQTLRDLLSLPGLRVQEMLPQDGQQFGFDKVAGALDISHVQMTKYLQAADTALRQSITTAAEPPERRTWRGPAAGQATALSAIAVHAAVPLVGRELAPGLTTRIVGNPRDDIGNTYRAANFKGDADSVALLTGVIGAHQPQGLQIDRFMPPVPGWYRVRFSTWGLRWERTRAAPAVRGLVRNFEVFGQPYFQDEAKHWQYTPLPVEKPSPGYVENVEFYGDAEVTHVVRASLNGEAIGYFDAHSLRPRVHEFNVWLNPGERVSFHAMTLPAVGGRNSGSHNGVVTYSGPGVAFDWFEVDGPVVEQWPPESHRRLFGAKAPAAHARPALEGAPTATAGRPAVLPLDAFGGAGRMVGRERLLNLSGTTTCGVNCGAAGEYTILVTASQTPAGNEHAKMRLLVDAREVPNGQLAVDAPRDAPATYRATFGVEGAGPVTLGIEFLNDHFDEHHPDPARRDRNLFLGKVELVALKPAPGAEPEAAADAATRSYRTLLLEFAGRAFRRPVTADEVAPYVALVDAQLLRGASFQEAMLAGYKAVLCSPDFLFIGLESGVPVIGTPGAEQLGGHAMASRLSYFLWNSLPDATLLELASKGSLSNPATLRAQADRMLDDPRSNRFVNHFLDEWLELKKIDFTTPDPNLYPEYDPWLHDSMLAESRAWFRHMLAGDRGVRELIASDTLLINQRLAELYGIRGVTGADLREVKIPPGIPRGGFLTQAAVLKVTANGTATSPVLRGVWVTQRLLGVPHRPPPPNIPAVEPDATGAVTIREMIEQHRASSSCAACHATIDPPGMALESFDVIGGWRERYRLAGTPKKQRKGKQVVEEPTIEVVSAASKRNRVQLRLGPEVDASGELADGRAFGDVTGLRELLLQDEEQLARNLVRQLAVYGTGAPVRFSDRPAVEAIVGRTAPTRYGVRSIVREVVASELFRAR